MMRAELGESANRKIAARLMTLLFALFVMSSVDRVNLGFAALQMNADLGLSSAQFGAAASILERRGPGEGIPAFALATFVGVARVAADKHHWYDVAAGAAIGTASGLLLTHPLADKRVAFAPWVDSTGGGASVAMAF